MTAEISLNEVQTVATKAARGAGLSWGLAEETGRAARWLACEDLDWASYLRRLLEILPELGPVEESTPTKLGSGSSMRAACPLTAGAWLFDRAGAGTSGPFDMPQLAMPIWVAPFAARATRLAAQAGLLLMDDIVLPLTLKGEVGDSVAVRAIARRSIGNPRFRWSSEVQRAAGQHRPRGWATPEDWRVLQGFVVRTYVPLSAESRSSGAGGGSTDDD